jgi:hypothetical protein
VAVRFDRCRRMPEVTFSWCCFVSLYLDRNNKGTSSPLEMVEVVGVVARVVHKTHCRVCPHWHIWTFAVSCGMLGYRSGCDEDPRVCWDAATWQFVNNCRCFRRNPEYAVAQLVEVVGSIPDGVIGIFHWYNPSCRTMILELTQPLTEMSTRNISCGVKAADA